jgi:hypothetical protein
MYATQGRYNVRASELKHYYGLNHLHYMHNNPVKRGLVKHSGDWRWSSWRFYFWNDGPILGIDRML